MNIEEGGREPLGRDSGDKGQLLQSWTGAGASETQSFCVALLPGMSDELPSVSDAAGGNISDQSCAYTPIAYTVMSLCGAVRGARMLTEERALQQSLPQRGFP